MAFAYLGDIPFDLPTHFDGVTERIGADFAEHALIERKPRLQYVGDKLDEHDIEFTMHSLFCDPEVEMAKLRDAVRAHEALLFVYENGNIAGRFVVVSLDQTPVQMMRDGTLIALSSRMQLREYVEDAPEASATPRQAPVAVAGKGKPVQAVTAAPAAREPVDNPIRGGK